MTDREVMQQALEALQLPSLKTQAMLAQRDKAITALRKALEQPKQGAVAWAVQGCSKMWRGEFAEIDAKAEAKRIGGTCVAYALYTTPPAAQRKKEHITNGDPCWCNPEIDYVDPETGVAVIVHKEPQ